jgi:hypothetical protein
MSTERSPEDVADGSPTMQPVLRVGDGQLVRSDRGTWVIDLRIPAKDGVHALQIPIGKHRAIDRLARKLHLGDASE